MLYIQCFVVSKVAFVLCNYFKALQVNGENVNIYKYIHSEK